MAASTPTITRAISPHVPEPQAGTWSNCLVVNGIAYVAGMVAREADGTLVEGGEYEQSKVIFTKIRNLLEAAGGAMADVVKVTIFVTDIRNREQVWRARREFFTGNFPASTLVEVRGPGRPRPQGRDRGGRLPRRRRTLRRPGGPGPHFSSEMEVGPGPGVTSVGHCLEPNGTGGGRNAFVPRLALSAMMAARASPPISS